jgi:predicted nucleic acid-binding protein
MRAVVDTNILVRALIKPHGVIVSGGKDLLALHPFAGIPILPPVDFLRMLDAGKR